MNGSFPSNSSRNPPTRRPHRQFYGYQHPRPSSQPLQPRHRHHPPFPTTPPRYNFTIQLCSDSSSTFRKPDVQTIISKLNPSPECSTLFNSGSVAAKLSFREWAHTLSAVTSLWRFRLEGTHSFIPKFISKVLVPSDMDELGQNLRTLFCEHIKALLEGDLVKKWQGRIEEMSNEIAAISKGMTKRNSYVVFNRLDERKKRLLDEKELLASRLREFKTFMSCLLRHLNGGEVAYEDGVSEVSLQLFNFGGECDWDRTHRLILRECRRLEDGLPIYTCRQEILNRIHYEQILVLIGETGSGKSTQLVQFLADSGIAGNESIVCTQPRKIAAISLAHRVREESLGCYKDGFVCCYPAFSSDQQFDSGIIYMTDNCLLQHYMNDKNLSGISCIIVDEAHERSLNTDLLLAMVKDLLTRRGDLRLVIMSATADADQLAEYFFGCDIFHVLGRNFPVDIRYVPCGTEGTSVSSTVASYVADVVRMAIEVHKREKEGTILAFLTSQFEVEWACDNFEASSAVALPLHGKLSFDDQFRIFQQFHGKRKVIFATNVAETSLTIPGVKYVIDSGMVKESKFEPSTGMNVLRVCRTSQSSAKQRAGRAGRTEPGICYRLYEEYDFELMAPNQEPEIRRVHLGVAVLRILALGIKNVRGFDFVDAPSSKAIDMAIRNLLQLGAIKQKNDVFELSEEGRYIVKLGIEPRLGKMILGCFNHGLGKEGIVLAAVMANASSIFCRVGTNDNKLKADCLKVQFCHHSGDLFTLLSVYREWENLPRDRKNSWCWQNSINAKSMRRCQDTVKELDFCLQKELNFIVPSNWKWDPLKSTEHDKRLKKVILSSLAENAAMYSGCDQLGYEVALTGQHVRLHPSCSLEIFGQKPNWVVFGELLAITNQYLVCVTAFDIESLHTLNPPPLFDASKMESRKLQMHVMTGFGKTLLKKFSGKSKHNILSLESRIRSACMDERIGIQINVEQNEILLFAPSQGMEKVKDLVNEVLDCERKWLHNECMEKCIYHGISASPPVALFGAGAEIKHLELEKRCLTVDIFHSNVNAIDDKELLMFLEKHASGNVCAIHKYSNGQESDNKERWGKVTFLSPDAVRKAVELNGVEFAGSSLKIIPSQMGLGSDHKIFSFPGVKAKVYWPRRASKGIGIVKCDPLDVGLLLLDFFNLVIGRKPVRCERGRKYLDSVVISGIDKELSESEVLDVLRNATKRRIMDFFLVRGDSVEDKPSGRYEEALLREIVPFMPKRNLHTIPCHIQVFPPEPKDQFIKAFITFDGRLHLEAAKALEQLEGKVLPGCLRWQKIKCQQLFHSSLSCPGYIYAVIKKQLGDLLASFKHLQGVECYLEENDNRSYRVRISANATRTVAELRRPLEELVNGRTINHASLTPTVLQHLFSRDGINLMKSIQQETRTYILFDRQSLRVRIFGSSVDAAAAEQKLVQSLMHYHGSKQLEVHLRGKGLPPDLMKQVVKKLGPDLHGLKEKVPGANLTLSTKHHMIYIRGDKELKCKVEEIVYEIAQMSSGPNVSAERSNTEVICPICLCEVEDGYQLESCSHMFCQLCLLEQCESAIKNLDSFPICCAQEGCRAPILLRDLKSLLPIEKLEELFRASLGAFVASSRGTIRFCPSPDCPSVYQVADPGTPGEPFACGACSAETCTRCHLEYHPYISCERYREFKEDPDLSLKDWCKGKDHVKTCPVCGFTIEKTEGCNHVECRCGKHICWVCLDFFTTSGECYGHLRSVHSPFE
ncbi:hypothetical protein SLEP1_g33189 [Rubroshorea leprosula]|uniref:RNA helicase n=1 Tax=Rubroshorea leprosula TaxID=152421 RepID=A0AAV5KFW6_9ROSI|nr:hypothetical protein SLEP1_g33189 [Rubroshorea leprosula]